MKANPAVSKVVLASLAVLLIATLTFHPEGTLAVGKHMKPSPARQGFDVRRPSRRRERIRLMDVASNARRVEVPGSARVSAASPAK